VRELMRHVGADKLVVSGRGLREGLLYEKLLAEDERNNSPSMTVARLSAGTAVPLLPDVRAFGVANASFLYVLDWVHAQQVCRLALELFDGLAGHYGLVPEERALLTYASLLHDCGSLIDYYRHHHHSAYLVENADLPGFTHDELAYLALLVRWHRHGEPSLDLYDTLLTGADLERIDKLVPCLRMAEDLERSRAQLVTGVRVRVHGAEIEIEAQMREPAAAELWAANRETGLWTQAFGKKVHVIGRVAPTQPTEPSPPVQETVSARAAWIQTMTR
jgi:exopolyphosphatase/guanosine-5'-triphosphate,3'-diphosphate pyrophosphatase